MLRIILIWIYKYNEDRNIWDNIEEIDWYNEHTCVVQ